MTFEGNTVYRLIVNYIGTVTIPLFPEYERSLPKSCPEQKPCCSPANSYPAFGGALKGLLLIAVTFNIKQKMKSS